MRYICGMNEVRESILIQREDDTAGGANLPVMETFYSLQGEGYHAGSAAYFVRLGGCDVGCHWCDVKESWNADDHNRQDVGRIAGEAHDSGTDIVIVTGGEPLMYPMDLLTSALKNKDLQVHLETSGAYPLTGLFDWICLSPKKFKPVLEHVYSAANELKVVVYNKSDFKWAVDQALKVGESCLLYLQPEWSKADEMMPQIIDFVKAHPQWKISLQTHKYLNIP